MEVTTAGGLTIEHPAQNRRFDTTEPDLDRAPIDTMPHGSFSSSNVHSAIYDFSARELYVRFLRDGPDAIYQYTGVPAEVWQGLVNANSKGRYVNDSIAWTYPYRLFGRDDFPERGAIASDLVRRFVYDP